MKYRPEIDGLRALAVIPVLLFHAEFSLFGGGFVGVDIFFVISGFLITSILLDDLEQKRFSLVYFYERRARRILPALFLVMFACIPFAWMWMSPKDFLEFLYSLLAAGLFASNFLLWQQSGYFMPEAEEIPLLHTWSLAVEEQFYLFFPILLFALWHFRRNHILFIIIAISLASFIAAEWGWRNEPIANFYLTPSRLWELLAGTIAAFVIHKHTLRPNNLLSLLGLACILYAIFRFDINTPVPSYNTLAPVVGTVLILLFSDSMTIVGRLLSTRLFVGIGLISYSAYLWHQPILAFARTQISEPTSELMALLLCLSLILAVFSWKFIEQPFRNKVKVSKKALIASIVACYVMLYGIVGFFFAFAHVEEFMPPVHIERPNPKPLQEDIWLIGDSHAQHLSYGLSTQTEGEIFDLIAWGCIPLQGLRQYNSFSLRNYCKNTVSSSYEKIIKTDPHGIVLIGSMAQAYLTRKAFRDTGGWRFKNTTLELIDNAKLIDPWQIYEQAMRRTFKELSTLKNATIVFAIDIPELGIRNGCASSTKRIKTPYFELGDLTQNILPDNCNFPRPEYDASAAMYRELVYKVSKNFPKIKIFDPVPYFCDTQKCYGYLESAGYLYRDYDHLTLNGSIYWAQNFTEWYLQEVNRTADESMAKTTP